MLGSYRRKLDPAASLPEWVQEAMGEDVILRLSWYREPFEAHFYKASVYYDNSVEYAWMILPDWSPLNNVEGRLSEEAMEQMKTMLLSLETHPLPVDGTRQERITVSFMWDGENRILTFDESACQGTIEPLLSLLAGAFQADERPSFPCQEEQPSSQATSTTTDELPNDLKEYHSHRQLCLFWFHVPLRRQERICVYSNRLVSHITLELSSDVHITRHMYLTDGEMDDIKHLMSEAVENVPLRRPTGDIIVTLGFPWNLEYNLQVTGVENCTREMVDLFNTVDNAFKRNYEADSFESPCLPAD